VLLNYKITKKKTKNISIRKINFFKNDLQYILKKKNYFISEETGLQYLVDLVLCLN